MNSRVLTIKRIREPLPMTKKAPIFTDPKFDSHKCMGKPICA